MEKDLAYFARRAKQEHSAASAAVDGRVRRAHLELARRYDAVIQGLKTKLARRRETTRDLTPVE